MLRRSAATAAFLLVIGSGQSAGAAEFERRRDVLIMEGAIDAAAVRYLEASLRAGDRLAIESMSGERAAALVVGRLVVERRVTVVVNGECTGPCASYVFLASKTRRARVGASVRYGRSPLANGSPAEAEAYRTLLSAAGVPEGLVHCADSALRRGATEVAVSPLVLAHFGVHVDGGYQWVPDEDFRMDYSREFAPMMTWLDDVAACTARGQT